MARITGKDLYLTFGSLVLSTDFQSFEPDEQGNLVEVTAGDDADATYAANYKSGKASFEALYDATAGATSGTAVWAGVAPLTEGTLTWSPLGTASGKPKYAVNSFVESRKNPINFKDAMAINVEFRYNGAVTPSTW